MKLSILVVAAALVTLPAISRAQGTDTTAAAKAKDTTMKNMTMKDTTMKDTTMMDTTMHKAMPRRARRTRMKSMGMDSSATRMSTSTGTDCPRGCPTSKGAAGLTGVQFLALQQELRDRGCGNTHVTGRYDAVTRHAVAKCAKELSVANNAGAVLVAMNIGYGAGDVGGASPPGEN